MGTSAKRSEITTPNRMKREQHRHLARGLAVVQKALAQVEVEHRDREAGGEGGQEPVTAERRRRSRRREARCRRRRATGRPRSPRNAGRPGSSATRPPAPMAKPTTGPSTSTLHDQQRPPAHARSLVVGQGDQDEQRRQDDDVVRAGLDVQGLPDGGAGCALL